MSQIATPGPYSPGLPPPPGVEPTFLEPYSLWPYYAETGALCIVTLTIFVAMRVYTKVFLLKSLTLEDFSCVLGWACTMIFIGMTMGIGRHGGGTHQWDLYYKDVQYHRWLNNYTDMVSIQGRWTAYCFVF